MSDILQAMKRRTGAAVPAVDVVALDEARLFPAPDEDQQGEFTQVATRLIEFKPARTGLVVAIASNVAGEGASFVSYNLARILALNLGRRVLWIDANLQAPQVKLADAGGTFAERLAAPAPVAAAEHPAAGPRLTVMPGGQDLRFLKAELASDRCRQVFESLRAAWEFVLVDCPPVLSGVETAWLGRAADGLVVVVEARRLKSHIIKHGLQTLRDQKVNVIGTVLNKRRYELPKAIYDRV